MLKSRKQLHAEVQPNRKDAKVNRKVDLFTKIIDPINI